MFVLAAMTAACRVSDLIENSRPKERLEFSVQPAGADTGEVIEPPVQITVRNAAGQPDLDYVDTVAIELDENPAGATLQGTKRVAAENGVATFDNLRIGKAGSGYTLRATAPARAPATSAAFFITEPGSEPPPPPPSPLPATRVAFTVQPSNVQAGQPMSPTVQVVARDASGNVATTFGGTITIAIGANPGGGTLSGTTSAVASNGVARFEGLRIDRSGNAYTLTAAASGLSGATSSSFNVATSPTPPPPPPPPPPAPVATRLVFAVQPTNVQVGAAITPPVVVAARDDAGNLVTGYGGTIRIEFSGNDHDATLSGTLSVAAVSGVAVFSNLRISRDHKDFRLRAVASGLTTATSNKFDVRKADDDDDNDLRTSGVASPTTGRFAPVR